MVKLRFKKDNTFGKYVGVYLHLLSIGKREMIDDRKSKDSYDEIIRYTYEEQNGMYPKRILELLGVYEFAYTRSIFTVKGERGWSIKIRPNEKIELAWVRPDNNEAYKRRI